MGVHMECVQTEGRGAIPDTLAVHSSGGPRCHKVAFTTRSEYSMDVAIEKDDGDEA